MKILFVKLNRDSLTKMGGVCMLVYVCVCLSLCVYIIKHVRH